MGEGTDSGGLISKEQLDQLVALFDRWQYGLDPESRDVKEAQSEFNTVIDLLYREVCTAGFKLSEPQFRAFVHRACQAAIVAAQKKPSSLPPSA
jgi:hypothetical protein